MEMIQQLKDIETMARATRIALESQGQDMSFSAHIKLQHAYEAVASTLLSADLLVDDQIKRYSDETITNEAQASRSPEA